MSQFNDLWFIEKKRRFHLLFSLENLKCLLWRDSNPGPCASQIHYTTIPNVLINKFWKTAFLQRSAGFVTRFKKIYFFIWKLLKDVNKSKYFICSSSGSGDIREKHKFQKKLDVFFCYSFKSNIPDSPPLVSPGGEAPPLVGPGGGEAPPLKKCSGWE